jgi:hypothetical protein
MITSKHPRLRMRPIAIALLALAGANAVADDQQVNVLAHVPGFISPDGRASAMLA